MGFVWLQATWSLHLIRHQYYRSWWKNWAKISWWTARRQCPLLVRIVVVSVCWTHRPSARCRWACCPWNPCPADGCTGQSSTPTWGVAGEWSSGHSGSVSAPGSRPAGARIQRPSRKTWLSSGGWAAGEGSGGGGSGTSLQGRGMVLRWMSPWVGKGPGARGEGHSLALAQGAVRLAGVDHCPSLQSPPRWGPSPSCWAALTQRWCPGDGLLRASRFSPFSPALPAPKPPGWCCCPGERSRKLSPTRSRCYQRDSRSSAPERTRYRPGWTSGICPRPCPRENRRPRSSPSCPGHLSPSTRLRVARSRSWTSRPAAGACWSCGYRGAGPGCLGRAGPGPRWSPPSGWCRAPSGSGRIRPGRSAAMAGADREGRSQAASWCQETSRSGAGPGRPGCAGAWSAAWWAQGQGHCSCSFRPRSLGVWGHSRCTNSASHSRGSHNTARTEPRMYNTRALTVCTWGGRCLNWVIHCLT